VVVSWCQRQDRLYVVAYDGLDPITGRERRRWHPAGQARHDAGQLAQRLERDHAGPAPARGGPISLGEFLTGTWLPVKRRHVQTSTAIRCAWFVDHYNNPAIGDVPLRRLCVDHLEDLYDRLATTGGRHGDGLAVKTGHEVHVIVRSALDLALRRQLVDRNVAQATNARHRRPTQTVARAKALVSDARPERPADAAGRRDPPDSRRPHSEKWGLTFYFGWWRG
jgi:hypothetical protein